MALTLTRDQITDALFAEARKDPAFAAATIGKLASFLQVRVGSRQPRREGDDAASDDHHTFGKGYKGGHGKGHKGGHGKGHKGGRGKGSNDPLAFALRREKPPQAVVDADDETSAAGSWETEEPPQPTRFDEHPVEPEEQSW